jgi:hypothetical protein
VWDSALVFKNFRARAQEVLAANSVKKIEVLVFRFGKADLIHNFGSGM